MIMEIAEITSVSVAIAAAVTAVVLQLSKKNTNQVVEERAQFSKEAHDEICMLKLIPVQQELKTIKEHESDAKETVKEIKESISQMWSRINDLVEETHGNHIEIMKALK